MSKRRVWPQKTKHAPANQAEPLSLSDQLGSDLKAWVFGAAARGTLNVGERLDVYVSGAEAERVETEYFGQRPLVLYEGTIYTMRVIGPAVMSEENFVKAHPEAIRVL